MANKMYLPESVQEQVNKFIDVARSSGFFEDEIEIPVGYSGNAEIHLWNFVGEVYLSKFLSGDETLLTEEQALEVLSRSITQANLDSLLDQGLIDCIEDEHGEMVYWATDKVKEGLNDIE